MMKHYLSLSFLRRLFFYILSVKFSSLIILAQPSGGPYGPVPQTYELPKGTGKIFYVSPEGKAEDPGFSIDKPTTIEKAFELVTTGDAIILRGGIYRTGNLILNQGITIQAYADEQPVLKGTYVADTWKDLGNGLWKTSWKYLFPAKPEDWWRRDRSGKITPLYRFNNDMVFADGKFLQSVGWEGEVDENTYYIDYQAGDVYIGINPADRLVEITAFDVAIKRILGQCYGKTSDHKGPVIRGITFTQYAYRAFEFEGINPEGISSESDHGKDIFGTTIENCYITFCSRVAAYLRGDKLVLRNCKISDTSTEGIFILSSNDVLLERNIFARNNIEQIEGYYPAAVKIFNQCYRATCRDNLIIDLPYSHGIWYDVGNVDGVFINNWVEGVGIVDTKYRKDQLYPSYNGFFFEISKGAVCAGNVFVNCDHGIMALNSSNVQIYQNTLVNSAVCIGRNERSAAGDHFGWHPSTGPDVDERNGHVIVNNLLTAEENYTKPLLFVWQVDSLCEKLPKPQMKQLDYNIYIRDSAYNDVPLIIWSPAKNKECQLFFQSPQDINKIYPEFSASSRYYAKDFRAIFKSYDLGNFRLLPQAPGAEVGTQIPSEISKLLGSSKKKVPYIGAYPPLP